MKCAELDRLLDDQDFASLSRPERAAVDEHLRGCVRCTGVWRVHEALMAETPRVPEAALERTLARLAHPVPPTPAGRPGREPRLWRFALPIGVAATALIGFLALWQTGGGIRPDRAPAAPQFAADIADSAFASSPRFVEGREYSRLATQAVPVAGTVVEEFFMYGCPHCFAFEDVFEPWAESRPDSVRVVRVPVVFNPVARLHARAHYAAEQLGIGESFRQELYAAIHVRHEAMASAADLAGLAAGLGADAGVFATVMSSPDVLGRVRRAESMAERYGIRGTPSLVVNGEFLITPGTAGSYEAVLDVAGELIADEGGAERAGGPACEGIQPKCPVSGRSLSSDR